MFLSIAKIGNLLLQLISVRLYSDWLGLDHYGLVLWVQAQSGYLAIFDIGLWIGIQRRLTHAVARKDQETADLVIKVLLIATWVAGAIAVVSFLLFGTIYRHAASGGSQPLPSLPLFAYAAVAYFGAFYYASCQFILASTERFGKIAKLNLLLSTSSAGFGLALTYYHHIPESIALGTALGCCITAVVAHRIVNPQPIAIRGRYRELMKEIVPMGLRGYPHRMAALVGRSADRIVIGGLSRAQITNYKYGCQLPEVLSDVLSPITQTTLPELTRAHREPNEFSRLIARNGLLALGVGCSFILMPSAFGHCGLHLWLNRDRDDLESVMFCMGVYRIFELFYSSLATPFYATGQVQRLIAFSSFNALVTAFGTYFSYRWGGLIGVGLMNALIGVAQFVPLLLVVRGLAGRTFPLGGFIARCLAVIILSVGVAATVHWYVDRGILYHHEFWALLFGPLLCGLWMCFLCGTRLCPTPDPVIRRLRRFGLTRPKALLLRSAGEDLPPQ